MTYNPHPQETEGNKRSLVVSDDDMRDLLGKILKELKKMNFQLSLITDNIITNQEID